MAGRPADQEHSERSVVDFATVTVHFSTAGGSRRVDGRFDCPWTGEAISPLVDASNHSR